MFLALLALNFEHVDILDQNTDAARELAEKLELSNVSIINADARTYDYQGAQFDAIVAANVLEHFQDLTQPITNIKKWLHPNGFLFTSLPTENIFYRLLRIIFRKTKPHDHYHTAAEVEGCLKEHGFKKAAGLYHPLILRIFPLFRISAWCKED